MKNFYLKISAICLIVLGTWFLDTQLAHAQAIVTKILGIDGIAVMIAQGLANILNIFQMIAAWILAMAGFLLNFSINLTLQMKLFLEQTPAVYITWKALRDISGLFIIFFLLFAAIKLILSIQDAKFGGLIKNIVIAGVLINFSFFFTSLGIDVSNIVSIQLYNAIAPANSLNDKNLSPAGIVNNIKDGGLSDIFMKSLQIPALYDTNKNITPAGQVAAAGGAWTAPIKIILIGSASIIIMLTAALSFAAASLAFIIRFVVLIFLLAFSPIWFASRILPGISTYATKWTDAYKSMLLFMPVYLLLMYLAMNILTTSSFLTGGDLATAAATIVAGEAVWYSSILTIAINAVIVIILLNFPLVAAISIGGSAVKFINTDKLGAAGMWRGVRNNTVGATGTRIIGGLASGLDKKIGGTRLGNTIIARNIRSATTGASAKAKFGTSQSYEDIKKLNKDVKKKNTEIVRNIEFRGALKDIKAGKIPAGGIYAIKDSLGKMSEKQRTSLSKEDLTNPDVVRYLKKGDYEAIKKSDDIIFSDDDKMEINDARKKLFESAVTTGIPDIIKHMMKEYDGNDLIKMSALLTDPNILPFFTQGQLKVIGDNATGSTKTDIKNAVFAAVTAGVTIPTEGWLRDQHKRGNW